MSPADHDGDQALASDEAVGQDVAPHMQHVFRNQKKAAIKAAKGNGKGTNGKKNKASGSSSADNDPEAVVVESKPSAAKKAAGASAKAKARAKAKIANSKAKPKTKAQAPATPAKNQKRKGRQPYSPRMNGEGLPLGCPTCRWAPRGCHICRKPGYKPRTARPNK